MKTTIHKPLYLIAILVCLIVIIFAIFYYTSGYDYLCQWYYSLRPCFYRSESWKRDFFTPITKEIGDKYCIIAFIISLSGIIYCLGRWKQCKNSVPTIRFPFHTVFNPWTIAVVVIALILWFATYSFLPPAYDEIFSAECIARLHPFQTLSYYMLPNNHIFFNLLNNLAFHFCADKVVTGRIISFVAFAGVLLIAFRWLTAVMNNGLVAFLTTILLALQLPTLSFSSQARGYELQLLAGWICFVSFFQYIRAKELRWIKWHAAGTVLGYILIPTFIYCHLAFIFCSFLYQIQEKKVDFIYLKYLTFSILLVFMFYLPVLCFSGIRSLTGNHVVVGAGSALDIIHGIPKSWNRIMSYGFGYLIGEHWLNSFLAFLPLLLLLSRDAQKRWLGIFYILLWTTLLLMVIKMKKYPFDRNLIIHFSLSLALIAYTLYLVVVSIMARLKRTRLTIAAWVILAVLVSYRFIDSYQSRAGVMTYGNDIKGLYQKNTKSISALPKDSAIAFSDESFYWRYYCRKGGYHINDCKLVGAAFYVKRSDEAIDSAFSNYILLRSFPDDYEVYGHY